MRPGQNKTALFPKTISILEVFGENIRLARLQRNISSSLQAEHAGISRPILTMIEKGSPVDNEHEKWLRMFLALGSSLGGARPNEDLKELWCRIVFAT